jgi:Ran GTPase-activating protein (RanGAP) involved in mRNA processing and transport
MEVASELKYEQLKMVRIWKGGIGDEGLRFICKFIDTSHSIQLLDLMDNGISALGCEFIGKTVGSPNAKLQQLKLDNNPILSEGIKNLALGLRLCNSLDKLSLKYCGIDA